jgi:hypothetical protein
MKTRNMKRSSGNQASLLSLKHFQVCYKKLGCCLLKAWYVKLAVAMRKFTIHRINLLDHCLYLIQGFSSALPPPSCVNDASMLLEFIMRSVTCVEEATTMRVFELVAIWADTIAYWDSWEEMEDQGVFNTIKEAINFHQRFDLTGFFLKMLPSLSENESQSSVIGWVSNFVTRAIAAYPSATWRACSCIHSLLHGPNFSLGTEDARKPLAVSFAQAAFSRFKSVSDSPDGIWKPLLLAISSCYLCYPAAIEQVLCNCDTNGYVIWTSALAQISSTSFSPGLSSASEIKLVGKKLCTDHCNIFFCHLARR